MWKWLRFPQRNLLRTLSSICDRTFSKNREHLKIDNYFRKKRSIIAIWQCPKSKSTKDSRMVISFFQVDNTPMNIYQQIVTFSNKTYVIVSLLWTTSVGRLKGKIEKIIVVPSLVGTWQETLFIILPTLFMSLWNTPTYENKRISACYTVMVKYW